MQKEILLEDNISRIGMPENLAIGLMVAKQHEKCISVGCDFDYFGFAFGQSPFHVPPPLSEALEKASKKSHYAESEGIYELRKAVADFNSRHFGLENNPERIVIGPGTKGLLFLLFSILSGDILIPVPSWIGYSPQASFLGKKHYRLPTLWENNFKLTTKNLDLFLAKHGGRQHMLVLNNPNNPTGQVYTKEELIAIAEVCRKYGTIVLADEIYALTTFEWPAFTSMGTVYPEGTFVLNGLSKDRSAGGYRLGVCHLPETDCKKIKESLKKLAATIYTNITTPVQHAAVAAYSKNKEIEEYFTVTREIHRIMGLTIRDLFAEIEGLQVTTPFGGFYFYIDFNSLKKELKSCGINTSNRLGEALLSHPHHIATVTGDSLFLPPDDFGVRIAYVDYDGHKAYNAYLNKRPSTKEEEIAFVKEHAPIMIKGAEAMAEFVASLKKRTVKLD